LRKNRYDAVKGLRDLLGFLTIIPVGMDQDSLIRAAENMHLFPLIGSLIGLMAGIFATLTFILFPKLLAAVLTLSFLLSITGLHHTDGLLDFGDGLMCKGTVEQKLKAMHDKQTGTGGFVFAITVFLVTVFSIAEIAVRKVLSTLLVAETSAKLAMVFGAWIGTPASRGMGSLFITAMHGRWRKLRLSIALLYSISIAFLLLETVGLCMVATSLAVTSLMVWISNRNFRGVTGDVLGAINELTRAVSLAVTVVFK